MKSKRLIVGIIIVVFAAVLICSAVAAFTVKQVKAVFSVSTQTQAADLLQDSLDKFNGKNLLFFDLNEVESVIEKNPYMEVTSLTKKYPNVIEVSIRERREVFIVEKDGKKYFTDEVGFVLCEIPTSRIYNERDYITLEFGDIAITDVTIGQTLQTDDDESFKIALSLANRVNLTDCIKSMSVEKVPETHIQYQTLEQLVITFNTYTNVEIKIWKAENKGLNKVDAAFKSYDEETSDYRKSSNIIEADEQDDGEIFVLWTR